MKFNKVFLAAAVMLAVLAMGIAVAKTSPPGTTHSQSLTDSNC